MMTSNDESFRGPRPAEPTALVVPLGSLVASDRTRTGSKAGRLAALKAAGLPVPDGFVITVEAGRAFADLNGFEAATSADRVRAGKIPDKVAEAVRRGLNAIGDPAVAVRSSAIAEDLAGASFAGMYDSVLDVRGIDAVLDAMRRVWASAHAARVGSYGHGVAGCGAMAILIQRLVDADAAGVAFTADPVTGARDVTIVSAVRGLGERLVSGTSSAEEWRIEAGRPVRTRNDDVLDATLVLEIVKLAGAIAAREGAPQDIEWAIHRGEIALLQARPLTALPESASWDTPWGGWMRNFRLGEWIGDPVTPSFESWLLTGIEDAMHDHFDRVTGWTSPEPKHIVVNGWYFYGLNLVGPRRFARLRLALRIPLMLLRGILNFRAWAALSPPLARLGFDWSVREWRERLLPAYRKLVAEAERAVASTPVESLPGWIDRLAASVGRNFASVVATGGYAAKAEMPLAAFWQKHLTATHGSWLELVRAGDAAEPAAHDVQGLDWIKPTLGELGLDARRPDEATRARIVRERDTVLARARAALRDRPKLLRKIDWLVREARRAHDVREEQARAMTLAWPALRIAIRRLGDRLVERGALSDWEQVFFLDRREILDALDGPATPLAGRADTRRESWRRQGRLAAPLLVGRLPPFFEKIFTEAEIMLHGPEAPGADEIRGHPGSPGRVTGPVKVLASADQIHRLAPGDILVAPVTTPAWTAAFPRIAAVVTDTGSIASHASIVAREYGIPAVVATGNATMRLRDGQMVTVDGSRGVVLLTSVPSITTSGVSHVTTQSVLDQENR